MKTESEANFGWRKWHATINCALLAFLAIGLNLLAFAGYHPGDADVFLIPWYEHIVSSGRVAVFAHPFANYSPPYLYLLSAASLADPWLPPLTAIKLLSCVGAVWAAASVYRLMATLGAQSPAQGALIFLILPSVVLNVTVLGQADVFWVAPCVLAVAAVIEERFTAAAIWSGIAFAFKAQAIFLAPFVIYVFMARRVPVHCWIAPPIAYIAALIPASLAGWPLWNMLTVYVRQAQWQPAGNRIFVSNSASWWTAYGALFPSLAIRTFWIGYATAAVAVVAYIWFLWGPRLSPKTLVAAAALSAAGLPFLLPGMHERFFILADVLTFCLAYVERSPRTLATAGLMQIASALPGYGWALGLPLLRLPACFFGLAVLLLLLEYLSDCRTSNRQRVTNAVEGNL